MTGLTGFRLTFADGTVFRATENVEVIHQPQANHLVGGFEQLTSIFDTFLNDVPGVSESDFGQVHVGFGAGRHPIVIDFTQWEGSTDTWGSSSSDDSAVSKLQTLNHALTNKQMDSDQPGSLEVYEYSSSGKYKPLKVAFMEANLPLDLEDASAFSATVTFEEAVGLDQPRDGESRGK